MDKILGPAKRDEQRLFYLGRELKSANRSLANLGIGNYGVYSIHLLSLAPQVIDLHNDDDDDVDRIDSGKRSLTYERRSCNVTANSTLARGEDEKVVDLLDSDSDDDDVIEIINAPSTRRRKT